MIRLWRRIELQQDLQGGRRTTAMKGEMAKIRKTHRVRVGERKRESAKERARERA